MSQTSYKIYLYYFLACALFITYQLNFPCLLKNDFMSFYVSSNALSAGINPYQSLEVPFSNDAGLLSLNLNPPFFLLCLKIFIVFSYATAIKIWGDCNFTLSVMGLLIVCRYIKLPEKYQPYVVLLFFLNSAYLSSILLGQLGGIFFFTISYGAYALKKQNYIVAGISWGIIAAVKIFPLLLLLFILWLRNKQLLMAFTVTILLCSLLPIFLWGTEIYANWFACLQQISWYQHSWNNSFTGWLYKIFDSSMDGYHYKALLNLISALFAIGLCACLIAYFRRYKQLLDQSQIFSLMMIAMLIISPLSWVYYLQSLLLPLLIIGQKVLRQRRTVQYVFLMILCMIFFPYRIGMVSTSTTEVLKIVTVYSLPFYGLIGLLGGAMWLYRQPAHQQKKVSFLAMILLAGFYCYSLWLFIQSYTLFTHELSILKTCHG